jgi:hypothetical protein
MEDIGPVSKEHRDEIWNQFSDLTKKCTTSVRFIWKIKRYWTKKEKQEIIAAIAVLATVKVNAHSMACTNWKVEVKNCFSLQSTFRG